MKKPQHHVRLLASLFVAGCILFAQTAGAEMVDPSTLNGKLIMGYQGWFSCPNDPVLPSWNHWKDKQSFRVEMLPDMSEAAPAERCPTGLVGQDGQPIYLFSSQSAATIDRHLAWMEQYGIDGIALQKFASQIFNNETQKRSDLVLHNVADSAKKHGRIFFLMYDLSGMTPEKLDAIASDIQRLSEDGLMDSKNYLKHRGHPILGLWGIGFGGRTLTPESIDKFITKIRNDSADRGGITILGGVPAYWRTGTGDADPNPNWKKIWPMMDVISPWTVGRYQDEQSAKIYRDLILAPDLRAAMQIGADLMPVVFPGFSWSNMTKVQNENRPLKWNEIPRMGGKFYWSQAAGVIGAGATMIYNAMFDEVDEGTAMFKIDPKESQSPRDPKFLTLDADAYNLPNDWYLRLAGRVNFALEHKERLGQMPSPER